MFKIVLFTSNFITAVRAINMVVTNLFIINTLARFLTSEKSEYHLETQSLSFSIASEKFMDRDNIDWSLPTVKIGWFFIWRVFREFLTRFGEFFQI